MKVLKTEASDDKPVILAVEGNSKEGAGDEEKEDEFYEVTLPKPLGIKFARGNDGGAYAAVIPPDDPLYDIFELGDRIMGVSASFGNDVWAAESYGQVMYAIKNRSGDIYLKVCWYTRSRLHAKFLYLRKCRS